MIYSAIIQRTANPPTNGQTLLRFSVLGAHANVMVKPRRSPIDNPAVMLPIILPKTTPTKTPTGIHRVSACRAFPDLFGVSIKRFLIDELSIWELAEGFYGYGHSFPESLDWS